MSKHTFRPVFRVTVYLTLVLAAHALAPHAVRAETPCLVAELPPSDRPIVEEASLTTNPANLTRKLTRLKEQSGVDQMLDLAGRTMFEEQWAYIPARGLWIEIGSNEFAWGNDSQVELDADYLMALLEVFGHVRVYHFHPAAYFDRPGGAGELPAGTSEASALPAGRLGSIGFALPSPADAEVSLKIALEQGTNKPNVNATFHVVSPYGVASYGSTERGRKRLVAEEGNPRTNPALTILVTLSLRRGEINVTKTVESISDATINEVINVLADQVTTPDYEVQFEPVARRPEGNGVKRTPNAPRSWAAVAEPDIVVPCRDVRSGSSTAVAGIHKMSAPIPPEGGRLAVASFALSSVTAERPGW